jgi:2-polyprenyl-3-methyl-5-hydroxy-6-metoxy-1,4-benzoquinol methylase
MISNTMDTSSVFDSYSKIRSQHWNNQAKKLENWITAGREYHSRLLEIYQTHIPAGSKILELGSGTGDLLSGLNPSIGLGIDFSEDMLTFAKKHHPNITFIQADVHSMENIKGKFDYIILSDLINDVWDVQKVFSELKLFCSPSTRVIINYYSRFWEPALWLSAKLGLSLRLLSQNWLTHEDVCNLLHLAGFELVYKSHEVLFPIRIPLLSRFFNNFLVKCFPFNLFGLSNFIICRPNIENNWTPIISVIIPARNEAGNIENAVQRIPEMGAGTEIIFVEGNSTDDTYKIIKNVIELHPEKKCQLFKQPGKGKADAVRFGFEHSTGDILMILDADLTVIPEDLTRFFTALVTGKGEFINGVRLVYPMEKEAMRFLNFVGNKFFSIAFSWLLGQPIKDTLCGTKVFWKQDYERIKACRAYFGDFDPFGDFDLLFGAARLKLKIVDLPVRYHERTYGSTNISRWSHGWLLVKMVAFAATKIKFI